MIRAVTEIAIFFCSDHVMKAATADATNSLAVAVVIFAGVAQRVKWENT